MWLLWSLTGHSSVLWGRELKEGPDGRLYCDVGLPVCSIVTMCREHFPFPHFWGQLLSEQISLICPQAGFDLSRCYLLSGWGIKGQCHNCKHLSIAGLLPWQFAYRRKCKQVSQEAVWLGNLPEILQASVRLRTSIVYLGIQILNQCS